MAIIDGLRLGSTYPDVSIIGSGPLGLSLALECEERGLSVLVLEAGPRRPNPVVADASKAVLLDSACHAPMELAVCRAFGGTSWTWGGRCVRFDAIDFEPRSHVPWSGWPISPDDLRLWYPKAAEYLAVGSDRFVSSSESWACLSEVGLSAATLERWSAPSTLDTTVRECIERSDRIIVSLNCPVVELRLDPQGARVTGVVVAGEDGMTTVSSRLIVLAAGGLETTRLLLATQRSWPDHFGGKGGPLGRYYMGHLSGKISTIALERPGDIADLDYFLDGGSYVRRRLTICEEVQREKQLLNIALWPDNPPFYDEHHRNAVLSMVFLALAFPAVGRLLLPEAIRQIHVGPSPHHYLSHVHNIFLRPHRTARDMFAILRDRFLCRPPKPGFLVRNEGAKYALHYHAEQSPSADSRVTLTNKSDRHGLPRLAVDLRFNDADAVSVLKAHEVLDEGLRASRKGRLEYWHERAERKARVLAQASDGFHQVGTTRMGTDPKTSVVNADCRTHDLTNLFVCATSVFPTTGQANPTFLGVALAVRLAAHLASTRETAKLEPATV
jgi:hypothetical protein